MTTQSFNTAIQNNNTESSNHDILHLFVIYDKVANVYGLPITYENTSVAVRAFKSIVNKEGTIYYEHSADFDLVHCGIYNKNSGIVQGLGVNEFVVNGFTLKD